VIAVFTKYDQFKREMALGLEDMGRDPALGGFEAERIFYEHYLSCLSRSTPFVRLESEAYVTQITCITLISVSQKCTNLVNGVLNSLN
jgi:hypothetical protein